VVSGTKINKFLELSRTSLKVPDARSQGKKEAALNKMFLQRQRTPTSESEPVAK
jgi:hypothetical protein